MTSPNTHFYITTPIYYVNDKPHIGHSYTTILADVLARSHRLLGIPTFFLTGTDEHGQKVQEAAQKNGITPQEHCDRTVVRFQEVWQRLGITNDAFIRTTEEYHKNTVRQILLDLHARGEIYAADYAGWYCTPCERFFTEKDLVEGNCPLCKRPVQQLMEKNYFFRMSKYQAWLVEYIEQHPEFIQPAHRRQETLGFLRQPLNDLCISRPKSRLAWGIPLPFDDDYVTYVWFDALINYISGIGYGWNPEQFKQWWPASYHLIGKDILTTHTVYWPIMLKAAGIEMPRSIFAHGWWLVGKDKMSKSLGNVVNPMEMIDRCGVDAFRYFLMAEMSLGQDSSFTEEIFVTRYNTDLANDLGNLASRVIKMVGRFLGGKLDAVAVPGPAEAALVAATQNAAEQMEKHLHNMQLERGLAEVLAAVREGNRYFDQMAPWKIKDVARLGEVLYHSAECLRIVSGLLTPVMPGKMEELRLALGLQDGEIVPEMSTLRQWGGLPAGRFMADIPPLFPRLEVVATDKAVPSCKEGGKPAKPAKSAPIADSATPPSPAPATTPPTAGEAGTVTLIELADFAKVKLKTGKVLAAEAVPNSDKLLCLQVEIGAETRQIVAGIAKFYAPAEMVGRLIVVVANLKPAKLRGVESQGMLLVAKSPQGMQLLTVAGDTVPSGLDIG